MRNIEELNIDDDSNIPIDENGDYDFSDGGIPASSGSAKSGATSTWDTYVEAKTKVKDTLFDD